MTQQRQAILDSALALAEEQGWEQVRLYRVAERQQIGLGEVLGHYREKEDLADAWFDRADAAMLQAADSGLLSAMDSVDRLEHLVLAWLEALAGHHDVTAQMIRGKLEPGHLHVQIPAVLRISRTVQALREAAHRNASGVFRGLEETVLSTVFVATFVHWLRDTSPDYGLTRSRLRSALVTAARLSRLVPGWERHHSRRPAALPGPDRLDQRDVSLQR